MKVLKQIFEVCVQTFCRKWEGETLPKWFFNFKQIEKCQNDNYPDKRKFNTFLQCYLLAILMLPISLLKRNLLSYCYFSAIFHDIKTIHFSCNTFVSYICWQGDLFSRIYRDGIKNIFHNILRVFRRAKIKYSNSNV